MHSRKCKARLHQIRKKKKTRLHQTQNCFSEYEKATPKFRFLPQKAIILLNDQSTPTSKFINILGVCIRALSYVIPKVSEIVARPSGVQLSQIVLILLPDHLPLELEGSRDEARLRGPCIWNQLDFGWRLKLLQSCLLRNRC